jgi:putative riboflavin transport system substrate-binding protein
MRIVTLRRVRQSRPTPPSIPPTSRRLALLALTLLLPLVGLLAACDGTSGGAGNLTSLTVGLTFVPNIQFAPFYVADAQGYYRDAGLKITFHHHNASEDEFGALVAGQEDAIFAGGDESLQARAQGPALVYVATVYTKYPVTLIVPASSPIHSAADLRGHSIGIPGKFGGTYIGLLALLKSAGLKESDVNIQSIGFNQVQTLLSHQVDAVMGYLNNEPIQLQKQGLAVRTIDVASVQPLISNGLVAMQSELQAHPDQIKALVAATLRGLDYTLSHPQDAVNLSKSYVPNLSDSAQAADALTVLNATIPLMRQNGPKPGYNDPAAWQSMASFLQSQGQLAGAVDVSQAYSNAYLP